MRLQEAWGWEVGKNLDTWILRMQQAGALEDWAHALFTRLVFPWLWLPLSLRTIDDGQLVSIIPFLSPLSIQLA